MTNCPHCGTLVDGYHDLGSDCHAALKKQCDVAEKALRRIAAETICYEGRTGHLHAIAIDALSSMGRS